jgi:hypothetical protein
VLWLGLGLVLIEAESHYREFYIQMLSIDMGASWRGAMGLGLTKERQRTTSNCPLIEDMRMLNSVMALAC